MKTFYTDHFVLPLPNGHRFPMAKYRLLRESVQAMPAIELTEALAASDTELLLAHDPSYLQRVIQGTLEPKEQREIGFPWTPGMVERSRRSVGATIAASRQAWIDGIAVNLAGGTHHAYREKGSGFCVFNDAAVAARVLQRDHQQNNKSLAAKNRLQVAIIDLDVHQGNGTASILSQDPSIFTLSLHGKKNFPFRKEAGDLDVPLPDDCSDEDYLLALDRALDTLQKQFMPAFLIYLAGADPHEDDRLGRLSLTFEGLKQRDERVFDFAHRLGIPVAVTMAGGYGHEINNTVSIHAQTVASALQHFERLKQPIAWNISQIDAANKSPENSTISTTLE
uniref:histone deacetylase family protein n=1 Tax=Orrella sp. TaxID=1921583 RepID=UPI00404895E0